MKIRDKVCLITGGARGLGKGYAEALLKAGAKVCVTDVLDDVLSQTVADFSVTYGSDSILGIRADVTDHPQMESAFDRTMSEFGGLDVVINSAGVHGLGDRDRLFQINLHGAIRGTELAVARMRTDKGGRGGVIVNVASRAGIYCTGALPDYHATKHALLGFTRSLGLELMDLGILFRVLCPASVDTDLVRELAAAGTYDKERAVPEGLAKENLGMTSLEEVVRACLLCIEDDNLSQGAVVKVISTGIFEVFPERAPCKQLFPSLNV